MHLRAFLSLVVGPFAALIFCSSVGAAELLRPSYPNQLKGFLSYSPLRSTEFFNDAHYTDHAKFNAGLDVDFLHPLGRYAGIGVGLRYGYGTGTHRKGLRDSEHLVFAPILLGLGTSKQQVTFGFGPAGAAVTFGAASGKPYLYCRGLGVEVAPAVTVPLRPGLGLTFGVVARALAVSVINGDDDDYYMEKGVPGVHGEANFRAGLTFDL
jgi:hypothetical protein